jgi:hypothetical protein
MQVVELELMARRLVDAWFGGERTQSKVPKAAAATSRARGARSGRRRRPRGEAKPSLSSVLKATCRGRPLGRLMSQPGRIERAELLRDCKRRGMRAPVLAVGDGALGFWAAIRDVFPETAHQRDWVHKAANVLDALPASVQAPARRALREISDAEDRSHAEAALERFAADFSKWPKAVAKLTSDREALLSLYVYPVQHWIHLRTSNPIESTFACVRARTNVTKGAGSAGRARDVLQADRCCRREVEAGQRAGAGRARSSGRAVRERTVGRAGRSEGRRVITRFRSTTLGYSSTSGWKRPSGLSGPRANLTVGVFPSSKVWLWRHLVANR